jgi:hypothetical protein
MPSLKAARRTRDRGEALDRHMSQTVQDRIAAGEDTDSFIARLLRREKEGKATISAFERDSLSGQRLPISSLSNSHSFCRPSCRGCCGYNASLDSIDDPWRHLLPRSSETCPASHRCRCGTRPPADHRRPGTHPACQGLCARDNALEVTLSRCSSLSGLQATLKHFDRPAHTAPTRTTGTTDSSCRRGARSSTTPGPSSTTRAYCQRGSEA